MYTWRQKMVEICKKYVEKVTIIFVSPGWVPYNIALIVRH